MNILYIKEKKQFIIENKSKTFNNFLSIFLDFI